MGHTKWQKREKTKGALEFRLQKLYETFARSAWWTAARNDPTVCPFAMKTVQVVWTGGQLFCFNWIYKSGMFHSKSKQPHDTFLKFLNRWQEVFVFFWGGGPSKKSADLSWNQYGKDDFQEFDCRFPWQFFHVFSPCMAFSHPEHCIFSLFFKTTHGKCSWPQVTLSRKP